MTITTPFPPGSVITARQRLWRVDAHTADVITASPLDGGAAEQRQFYTPLEHIQSGALPPPDPHIVGHLAAQELLLRAYRLSLLHGTAPLISLQRSRVIPKDYQLVPVVMALETPRVRLLIADDVGLGKTIEAGLVLTELLARQRAARVLVIVPANLREQWREALDYFFHLPARIISTRQRRQMERELPAGTNPWRHYRYLITSVDYAKQPTIKNQILEHSWDIVLIDEAHQVAKPHQSGLDQRVHMARWELAEALAAAPRVRHLLLLTATPHNGYTDSFASLLRMLDVGAVTGAAATPQIARDVAARYVCQRRRADVEAWFRDDPTRSPFPARDHDEVIVAPTTYEMDAIRAVGAYGDLVLDNAATGTAQIRTLAHWTVMHLHKRALSSPEALRCSLRNRRQRLKQQLRETSAPPPEAAITPEAARATVLDEDHSELWTAEEAVQRTERVVYGSAEQLQVELEHLEAVLRQAEQVIPRRDSKLQKLLDTTLRERLQTYPHVVIFTRYVDTMNYLAEQMRADARYRAVTILTLWGDLNERQRQEIFYQFERATPGVLIATDAISEGINLQHIAAQVIHYELPWNPNRLEQRNGRVDRFGQRQPIVYIRTMVLDETLDAKILEVLVRKAQRIRADYGFAPPFFGDDTDVLALIQQHEIKLLPDQLDLFNQRGAPEVAAPLDPFAPETLERIKGESFYGQTHISLPEIERRLAETAATVGAPAQIQAFVFSGLAHLGCPVTENADGSWRITLANPAVQTAGQAEVLPRVTFDAAWGLRDAAVTVLDLSHPVVRRLIAEVKRQAFRAPAAAHYGRTAYLVTAAVAEVTAVFHLLARYVVQTTPPAIVEELLPVAVRVYGEQVVDAPTTRALLAAQAAPQTRTVAEVQETLTDALNLASLSARLTAAVAARRAELAAERQEMQRQMVAREGTQAAWLRGIAELSPGSYDMLTVTVYYPA